MKYRTILNLAILVLLPALPAAAEVPSIGAYGDDYASGDYGRILHEENGVSILRGHDDGARDTGTVNAPIFPGDTLQTDADQRVEVQLFGGTLVRLDSGTELTFLSLPSPTDRYSDNVVLQLTEGTIRISARVDEGNEFRVDTPASSVYLLGNGDFRIEADSRGRSLVFSRRGVAELSGEGGSILVRAGMMSEALPGNVPEEARSFNTFASDTFDRWVADRDDQNRQRRDYYGDSGYADSGGYDDVGAYEEIPEEVQPYYGELSRNGRWVYVDDYGYGWQPTSIASEWRPYYYGYWSYGPNGYFWVSHEPWGWAPYHYGRWHHTAGYGWTWFPGRVFAGAWVSWSWGSVRVGWAPLDYYGYPAHYTTIRPGYYDPYCWVFVDYHHVYHHYNYYGYHHNYHHYNGHGHHGHGGHGGYYESGRDAIVTRAPKVSPRQLSDDPAARTRAYRTARGDEGSRFGSLDERKSGIGRRTVDIEDRLANRARRASDVRRAGNRTPVTRDAGRAGERIGREGGPRNTRSDVAERIAEHERGPGTREDSRRGAPRQPRRITADAPRAGSPDRASGPTRRGGTASRAGSGNSNRFGSGSARGGTGTPQARSKDNATPPRRGGISRVDRPERDRDGSPSRRVISPQGTEDRRRDLYRNVSRPREARERAGNEAAPRATAPRRTPPPSRSASPQRPSRGDTPTRSVSPRSSQRSGSRSSVTQRPTQRPSRPSAQRPSQRSTSRPSAAPRSTNRGGSKPSASRSSSKSSAPKRSTARGGGSGGKSKPSGGRSSARGSSGSKSKSGGSKGSSSRSRGGASRRR
jgi:hypothetical protein